MGWTYEETLKLAPQVAALHPDAPGNRVIPAAEDRPKRLKYHNVRTEYRGVTYASRAEANRAASLDAMIDSGEVRWWIGQPKFRLGVAENVYIADFLVMQVDGSVHVEDVKGIATPKFKRDLKLWKRYGPCPLVVIVGGKLADVVDPTDEKR